MYSITLVSKASDFILFSCGLKVGRSKRIADRSVLYEYWNFGLLAGIKVFLPKIG